MYIKNVLVRINDKTYHTIYDSDFIETIEMEDERHSGWEAVIRVYEQKNLNVASNLMRCITDYATTSNLDIISVISAIKTLKPKEFNPSFHKYEIDIEKYLMLL